MRRRFFAVVLALLAWTAVRAGAASQPHDFLRTVGRLSTADLSTLERGEAVARVLDTERREVAVIGAVRIRAPRARLLDRYRDLSHLRKSDPVLQVGAFGKPPRAGDLRPLAFEPYDLDSVRDCEPGDCPVRLSASAMRRFQQSVDWKAPGWRDLVASTWRDVLADLVVRYLADGDAALFEYHNKEAPLRVADEFTALYAESDDVARLAPEPMRYIREFPRVRLDGVQDILYWSKEDIGLRPIISVTHQTIYDPSGPRLAMIATKQLYATHYFDAALGLTLVFDDGTGGFYMVSVNRARTRSLTSVFRTMVRSTVQGRSRDAMQKILTATKRALEATADGRS